jgi:hypothetical protein
MKHLLEDSHGMAMVIIVFIVSILLTFTGASLLFSQLDLKITSNYKTGTSAFHTADAGIESAKAEVSSKSFDSVLAGADGNKSSTSDNGILSLGASVAFNGGAYEVRVTDNDDGDGDVWHDTDGKVYITSTGRSSGSTRVVKILVSRANLDFNAAITVLDEKCETHQGGSATVTGLDYTYNPAQQNNPIRANGPDVHAIARSCTTIEDDINKPNQITGTGSTPDITSDIGSLTLASLRSLRDDLISRADIIYHGSTNLNGGTLGTREEPKITYVDDTLVLEGNVTGAGFLIVDKDFEIKGNFTFEGIILVGICPTCPGRMKGTGNGKVYGAMVLANPTSSHDEEARLEDMTGNSSIYYSTYGIGLALNRSFKTIGWQELMN